MKKLLLRLTTAVLLLGLAGSLLYAGLYLYTTWHTDQLSARLSRQRSIAAEALSPELPPTLPQSTTCGVRSEVTVADDCPNATVMPDSAAPAVPTNASDAAVMPDSAASAVSTDASDAAVMPDSDAPAISTDASDAAVTPDSVAPTVPTNASDAAVMPDSAASAVPTNASNAAVTPASDAPAVPDDGPNTRTTAGPVAASEPVGSAASPSPDVPANDPLLTYYNALADENPDMIGWVSIADTLVDYPVMYTPENPQYYLNHGFDRKYTVEGMPFLDGRCDADAPSDNLIIYGHNMRSGRMFGSLSRYREEEYRQAHPLISFDTLKDRRLYRLYAGFVVRTTENPDDADMICYRMNLTSDEAQLQVLLDYASLHALFVDPEVAPRLHDQLLTLSTCTSVRRSERFVLLAVRVE